MKNITICIITALALAGGITEPPVALDDAAPETAAAPVAGEEAPAPEAPVSEDEGEPEGVIVTDGSELSESEQAEPEETEEEVKRDSITEGLICHMEGWVEACRAPDLVDVGIAPPPETVTGGGEHGTITEGLTCVPYGVAELCWPPSLVDPGLAPLPDGTPVAVVTEEQVQEPRPVKAKRPGVPKTGY